MRFLYIIHYIILIVKKIPFVKDPSPKKVQKYVDNQISLEQTKEIVK